MKKQYIQPEIRVYQIVAPRIMAGSGEGPRIVIKKNGHDDIYADDDDVVLSRRNYNLWDDFEEDEW